MATKTPTTQERQQAPKADTPGTHWPNADHSLTIRAGTVVTAWTRDGDADNATILQMNDEGCFIRWAEDAEYDRRGELDFIPWIRLNLAPEADDFTSQTSKLADDPVRHRLSQIRGEIEALYGEIEQLVPDTHDYASDRDDACGYLSDAGCSIGNILDNFAADMGRERARAVHTGQQPAEQEEAHEPTVARAAKPGVLRIALNPGMPIQATKNNDMGEHGTLVEATRHGVTVRQDDTGEIFMCPWSHFIDLYPNPEDFEEGDGSNPRASLIGTHCNAGYGDSTILEGTIVEAGRHGAIVRPNDPEQLATEDRTLGVFLSAWDDVKVDAGSLPAAGQPDRLREIACEFEALRGEFLAILPDDVDWRSRADLAMKEADSAFLELHLALMDRDRDVACAVGMKRTSGTAEDAKALEPVTPE